MHRRYNIVTYILIATGIILIGLLVFTLNRGPLTSGFPRADARWGIEHICLWCGDAGPSSVWDALGTALIILLILLIPFGHLVLLLTMASWLRKGPQPPKEPHTVPCPACGSSVRREWKACPFCGEKLA